MRPGEKHYRNGDRKNRPYNFFGDYLLQRYHTRVLKLPIDAGLGCPNRDGTLDDSGCIFCSAEGSASPSIRGISDIADQMSNARQSFRRSDEATRFIAYFQAFSNTYGPPELLKKMYDTAVSGNDIVGLMIGTRPDCLSNEIIEIISSYAREDFELWLEIGMQTMHDRSLDLLNRRHTHADTRSAVLRAGKRNIRLCAHLILGIPGETWEDMMSTAREVSSLPINGVKLHHLHVIKDTPLADLYAHGDFKVMEFRDYISTVCDFIERLRPDILIHRLLGDREETTLLAPLWGLHKGTVLKAIEDEFLSRGSRQGLLFE